MFVENSLKRLLHRHIAWVCRDWRNFALITSALWFKPLSRTKYAHAYDVYPHTTEKFISEFSQHKMIRDEDMIKRSLLKSGMRVRDATRAMQVQLLAAFAGDGSDDEVRINRHRGLRRYPVYMHVNARHRSALGGVQVVCCLVSER